MLAAPLKNKNPILKHRVRGCFVWFTMWSVVRLMVNFFLVQIVYATEPKVEEIKLVGTTPTIIVTVMNLPCHILLANESYLVPI